jgi:RNA polymerase sigma-70 factor, ECF subfamily
MKREIVGAVRALFVTALSPDDPDLILRLRGLDRDAIGDLYDRYGKMAHSVALRMTRDQSTAEDLVHEVFLRVWSRAQSFDPARGSLAMWILCMTRSLCFDHLRASETRIARQRESEFVLDNLSVESDLVTRLSTMQQMQAVRVALDHLNENQRSVLQLAYFEGLSHSEIADRLSQPLGTIKTWMRTALIKIRQEVAEAAAP